MHANPLGVKKQYERQIKELREAYGEAMLESRKKKIAVPAWRGREMIEESPSFGYRTVAHLLEFNKNTVQRVYQLMGWQLR
ncbi:hypothetical protein GCM10027419_38890 [Pandoraea terrae]